MQRTLPVIVFCMLFLMTACTVIPETPQVDLLPTSAAPEMLAATLPSCPTVACPTCAAPAIPSTETEIVPPTVTPTFTATNTKTVQPTITKTPTSTATNEPTKTKTPTTTPTLGPYSVQANSPLFTRNFARSEKGCNWIGLAGQVFDSKGVPVNKLVVVLSGTYNGKAVNLVGMTGMSSGLPYGPGGFEFVFGTKPYNTVNDLNVQVFDLTGVALTNPLSFSTVADCKKNLIIINFKKR